MATQRMLSASTLRGQKVYNYEEQELGRIEEFMLNLQTGQIGYVVLSFGGVMGVGDKLFAVPYQALTPDAERRCFYLRVSKDDLRDAPGFDKHHWPTEYNLEFEENIYKHYGVQRTPPRVD